MTKDTMIGVDLAKNVFQLHAASMTGQPKFRKKLSRQSFSRFMAEQAPAVVVMDMRHIARAVQLLVERAKMVDVSHFAAQLLGKFAPHGKHRILAFVHPAAGKRPDRRTVRMAHQQHMPRRIARDHRAAVDFCAAQPQQARPTPRRQPVKQPVQRRRDQVKHVIGVSHAASSCATGKSFAPYAALSNRQRLSSPRITNSNWPL